MNLLKRTYWNFWSIFDYFLTISDVCRSGWSYFNGICYRVFQQCANWTEAARSCSVQGAHLAIIQNQTENIYVQKKHEGASVWLGLVRANNKSVWYNGSSAFTFWQRDEPRQFDYPTCILALGKNNFFLWKTANCTECHRFTCAAGKENFLKNII